jgi:hypothetical protein
MLISAVSSRLLRRSRSRLGTSALSGRLFQTDGTSLHVEEAEDKLVQATETAIGLMKAVLENVSQAAGSFLKLSNVVHWACSVNAADRSIQPEPLQNLSNLVKAQLIFFSTAAETLSVSDHALAAPAASSSEHANGHCDVKSVLTSRRASRARSRRPRPLRRASTVSPAARDGCEHLGAAC